MADALCAFAVIGKIADGDGVTAVAIGEQAVGFVNSEAACRGFEVKQAGLLQAVHIDDCQFRRRFIADKGVTRGCVHIEEFLHHRFGGEAFAVLVGDVERDSADEGSEDEQGLFHGNGGFVGMVWRWCIVVPYRTGMVLACLAILLLACHLKRRPPARHNYCRNRAKF